MDESLLSSIFRSQGLEFALFNPAFQLEQYSQGLIQRLPAEITDPLQASLADVFPELVGNEDVLSKIRAGAEHSIQIEHIKFLSHSSTPDASPVEPLIYFDLYIYPYQGKLLIVTRNVTKQGQLEQQVVQQRNELHLQRHKLIRRLRAAYNDLHLAYETTLEGWVETLELRNAETKGHSQRVVEMTLHLARLAGVDSNQFVNLRHGALLHDIGKMGIPDKILLKPGPLSTDEMDIMRLHPVYGYELLSPIEYLKPALDIPLYHHEKWDGSGYPGGLKGEDIPLSARLFSIVDVYDALGSDRPYRSAWGYREVLNYIDENDGTFFDPQVVHLFHKIV